MESDLVGETYLGGMARYLQKAKELTRTVALSELKTLKENILNRIITVHIHPFSSCIPREGSESRAKCSKMGVINAQDAKPEFCLECVHSLITAGNIRGIVVTIQPMIKEAMHPDAMGFMLEGHLSPLRSAYKRIKQLRKNANDREKVNMVLNVIANSIKCIEDKLKNEEKLNGT